MQIIERPREQSHELKLSPSRIIDVHLEPFIKCYWNKCTFCGINNKYTHEDCLHSTEMIENKLKKLHIISREKPYIWFIDEAIHPTKLRKIAEYLKINNTNVIWQARCRIDVGLLDDGLPELLSETGLKELRLGLESASYTVLRLMNKFDDKFSLELVEKIVSVYTQLSISIHFPIIIGFPGEDKIERQKTYEFLFYLQETYSNVTFNINLLNLDISSRLFHRWFDYDVSAIRLPCLSQHFLGNFALWESNFKVSETILDIERNKFMREKLYPWMPANALTKPVIFYRLSETIRNTLIWKMEKDMVHRVSFSIDMILQKAPNVMCSVKYDSNLYFIYNWDSHHFMEGNQQLIDILDTWQLPRSVKDGIEELEKKDSKIYNRKDLIILLSKLLEHGYLINDDSKEDFITFNHVRDFYNILYYLEEYPYQITPDYMLFENLEAIPVGRALELEIGTGKNVEHLLRNGYTVRGIDFSEVVIEKLRKKYPDSRCIFEVDDLRCCTIEAETYSLVVVALVFSHMKDEEIFALSKKIINGLKPGGYVYVTDLSDKDPMLWIEKDPLNQRNHFTRKKMLALFPNFEVLKILNIHQEEKKRSRYGGYFDLLVYLGRKPEITNIEEDVQ